MKLVSEKICRIYLQMFLSEQALLFLPVVLGADLLRGNPFLQGLGLGGSAVLVRATDVERVVVPEAAVPVGHMRYGNETSQLSTFWV